MDKQRKVWYTLNDYESIKILLRFTGLEEIPDVHPMRLAAANDRLYFVRREGQKRLLAQMDGAAQ